VIIIPPQHHRSNKPATQHETTVGMFVVFVIAVVIALVVFIVGPLTDNPPPFGVGLGAIGFALFFGIIAFFSWMKEQSDPDAPDGNNQSSEQ
jgi:drug/metabolite transporter (DMT)-like permease